MNKEMKFSHENNVWDLVELPPSLFLMTLNESILRNKTTIQLEIMNKICPGKNRKFHFHNDHKIQSIYISHSVKVTH